MLKLELSGYSDAYIVAKGEITTKGTDNANRRNEKVTFKTSKL